MLETNQREWLVQISVKEVLLTAVKTFKCNKQDPWKSRHSFQVTIFSMQLNFEDAELWITNYSISSQPKHTDKVTIKSRSSYFTMQRGERLTEHSLHDEGISESYFQFLVLPAKFWPSHLRPDQKRICCQKMQTDVYQDFQKHVGT